MIKRETLAALLIVLLGVPSIGFFARAMADGAVRAEQAPIQAVLGQEAYRSLRAGETTPLHYLGNNLTAPDFALPDKDGNTWSCLLYTSPSPRDRTRSRMPSSA